MGKLLRVSCCFHDDLVPQLKSQSTLVSSPANLRSIIGLIVVKIVCAFVVNKTMLRSGQEVVVCCPLHVVQQRADFW